MWFYDNWHRRKTTDRPWLWMLLAAWAGFIILAGTFMTVAGTYGSIVGIMQSLSAGGGSRPWTCEDNSNS